MDRRLRNRIVVFLVAAGILAFALVRLSGREPVAKISAVSPVRETVVSSISSNGKVEPISPYVVRAQLDTFVERVMAIEGQNVKRGQLLLELNVKDAAAQLADDVQRGLRQAARVDPVEHGGEPLPPRGIATVAIGRQWRKARFDRAADVGCIECGSGRQRDGDLVLRHR